MVQNHMLQLLCLVAMEPPAAFDADAVRDEKLKVLRALKPIDRARRRHHDRARPVPRRAPSTARRCRAIREELGHAAAETETFVALKAEIAELALGRRAVLPAHRQAPGRARVSEIVVQFRAVPHSIFREASRHARGQRLVIRLQPDEGHQALADDQGPGPGGMRLQARAARHELRREPSPSRSRDAYERLLMDVMRGNPTLFMRRDEVEAAWRWIDPIREAWARRELAAPYAAGTWGPAAAIALIERDGRTWHEDFA